MNTDQREIARKLRILQHADETGHVAKTCRYFGVGRSSFHRWREAYRKHGEAGLVNRPPIPKRHANRTPIEIEEKILHLRSKYHLGPRRIVWYLARYHGIRVSDASASCEKCPARRRRQPPSISRTGLLKFVVRYYFRNIALLYPNQKLSPHSATNAKQKRRRESATVVPCTVSPNAHAYSTDQVAR